MLIDNIKRSSPFILFLLIIVILFYWLNPLNSNLSAIGNCTQSFMPLNFLFLKITSSSTFLNNLIPILLFIILSFLISQFNFKYAIIDEQTYMPSMVFIIITLSLSNVKSCTYSIIIGIFILLMLEFIVNTYKKENLSYNILNASIILGLSSLFYFNAIFYIFFLISCLLILRPFFWREWMFVILGIVLNYYFLFTLGYLNDYDFKGLLQNIESIFHNHVSISFTMLQKLQLILVVLTTLIASIFVISRMGSYKILVRKIHNLFFILFLNSLGIILFIPFAGNEIFVIMSLASSILISNFFIYSKHKKLKSILFYLLIIVFFSIQFEKFIPADLVKFFSF